MRETGSWRRSTGLLKPVGCRSGGTARTTRRPSRWTRTAGDRRGPGRLDRGPAGHDVTHGRRLVPDPQGPVRDQWEALRVRGRRRVRRPLRTAAARRGLNAEVNPGSYAAVQAAI